MENFICEYGCGKEASFILKNGKHCCSKSSNSCPEMKKKNKEGCLKAYKEERKKYTYNPKSNWNKGLTCLSVERGEKRRLVEDIFCKNSTTPTGYLKNIIIKENLIEYKCSCGIIDDWNNKLLILELDHINGDRTNNELTNLRFLCPNCHSQTTTFKGKGIKKFLPSEKEIIKVIRESKNIRQVLLKLKADPKGMNYYKIKEIMFKEGVIFK